MAEILWSLASESDLKDIEDYISRDSIVYAVNFVDRIVEATEVLAVQPRIGRVVPEFERDNIREVIFRGYRIIYLLVEDAVTILRVIHGTRNLQALVQREPWNLI